jgi:hypothetical protein
MSSGSYDVMMEQGPSYATKREQAQDGMTAFIQAFPPAAPLMGDIYAKIDGLAARRGDRRAAGGSLAAADQGQAAGRNARSASRHQASRLLAEAAGSAGNSRPSSRPSRPRQMQMAEAQAKANRRSTPRTSTKPA